MNDAGGGNWHRRLWQLAAPMILANLTVPLLGAVDTAVAGHLPGAHYLGGVALGSLFFTFIVWGLGFLRMGTTGLAAQAIEDGTEQRLVLTRGLLIAALLGLLLVLLHRPLAEGALFLLGGSAAAQATARAYIFVRIWSAPAALANLVILGWLLGRQKPKLGLALQILINGWNAAAAVLLVLGLGWGIRGIAAATASAEIVGAVVGLLVVRAQLGRGAMALDPARLLDRGALRRLVAINRDLFLRTTSLLFAFAYFTHAGATLGDTVLAANALLLNFQTFTSYGLDGLANAAESLVGSAIGRRRRDAFRAASWVSLLWAFITGCGFSLAFLVAGPAIVRLLSDLAPVREAALAYLPWAIASPLISAWTFQLDGIFIGATQTRELRNSMVLAVALYVASVHLLMPSFGNDGLWAAFLLLLASRAIGLGLFLPRLDRSLAGSMPQPGCSLR